MPLSEYQTHFVRFREINIRWFTKMCPRFHCMSLVYLTKSASINIARFLFSGKALCLLTKQDLGERCPGAGDLIHNVLRWLIRDGYSGGQHLPQSPVTPHFPITPSWCLPIPPPQEYPHVTSTPTTLHNSVTLSPAPSVDSQSGSPKQPDQSTSSAFSALSNGNFLHYVQEGCVDDSGVATCFKEHLNY